MDEDFLEYYSKHKDLIDKAMPKDVLERLLNKAKHEAKRGDAWEPPMESDGKCPF